MKSLNDSLTEYKKINLSNKSLQSHEKFLQRLKTYELYRWFAKPIEFSPIECARHGWINLTKDTLKCVICSNILYYYSQSPLNNSKALKTTYGDEKRFSTDPKLLVEKHNQNCPWRTLIVSDQLIQVDVYDEEVAYKNFISNKNTFNRCQKLPFLDESIYEVFKFKDSYINKLLERKSSDNNEKTKAVIILSCCGWTYKEDKNILSCNRCLRSIGLWLYKSDFSITNSQEDDSNDSNSETGEINILNKDNREFIELFGNTDIQSDESIVRNVLNKIINTIEIDQEASFKNMTKQILQVENKNKSNKRKFNDSSDENDVLLASINDKSDRTKKKLDPINEHFSWCPWLVESESKFQLSNSIDNVKKMNKNICLMNFDAVNKYLAKMEKNKQVNSDTEKQNSTLSELNKTHSILNSDSLLEKVKSVQSILINCTSQFSLK